MIGTQEVQKIMHGTEELTTLAIGGWSFPVGGDDYSKMPFTIEVLNHASGSSAGTITLTPSSSALYRELWYSKNGGEATRLNFGGDTTARSIPVTFGDKIEFAVQSDANGTADGSSSYIKINSTDEYFKVYGNIMSLAYVDYQSATTLPSNYCFCGVFRNSTKLIDAENLVFPAETLTMYCYANMFDGCTGLTVSPIILPATILVKSCYREMFNNCRSLTTGPELPSTTLAQECYGNMFFSCVSLSAAPYLPSTSLARDSYYCMFYNCSSLNYIKCLATDISASDCTTNWVKNVPANGTFVKDANMSSWTTGVNGIPDGWTVENA